MQEDVVAAPAYADGTSRMTGQEQAFNKAKSR
jgi:hypothetical protein